MSAVRSSGMNLSGGKLGGRLRRGAGRVFSLRQFLYVLATVGGGFLLAGPLLPGWSLAGLLGVLAGAFLFALWRRAYVETAVAGAVIAAVATLLDYFVLSVFGGLGIPLTVFGVGAGGIAALIGHYLGRDLHAGLTRDL